MKNQKVAEEWVKHMLDGIFNHKPIKGTHFYGIDNYLVSYETPICQYNNGIFVCSTNFYSRTTERHKFFMNSAIMRLQRNDPRIVVETVPIIEGKIYL